MRQLIRLLTLFSLSVLSTACTTTAKSSPELPETVKYFHVKPYGPKPGVEYIRFTARVRGKLSIKNECVMIGPHIPIFANDLVIAKDRRGIFIQHENGGRKYRIGDHIDGGGGYREKFVAKPEFVDFKNGATPDICKPQRYRPYWGAEKETGSYVGFYLSEPE